MAVVGERHERGERVSGAVAKGAGGAYEPVAIGGGDGARDGNGQVGVFHLATLPRAEYRFYRALLLAFPEHGGAPDRAALTRLASVCGVPLEPTLALLARKDCVRRDSTTGAIRAAYPFSGVPTPHRVTLPASGQGAAPTQIYAMCALDALGIPLMLRRSAVITSVDALTGGAVRVMVTPSDADALESVAQGVAGWMATWEPATAAVFARHEQHDCTGDASCACCPLTNFFGAPAHAADWLATNGWPDGGLLTQAEALRRAHALFAGLLDGLADDDAQQVR